MTGNYSNVAQDYDAHRIGYSLELYLMAADFGFPGKGKILDVACGTGLASEPFAKEGAHVTGIDNTEEMLKFAVERIPGGECTAEKLPFEDKKFDATICAQAIHWMDRERAIAEMIRVRQELAKKLGFRDPKTAMGGFLEFYRAPFADHTLRVIPCRLAVSLERFIGYERSRKNLRDALGSKSEEYFQQLDERLREVYGPGNPLISLGYLQFLYLGKKL